MTDREAMKMALDALEYYRSGEDYQPTPASETIHTLRQALAQDEQELAIDRRLKVKLGTQFGRDLNGNWFYLQPADKYADQALTKHSGYTAPPKRAWVGLTDEERMHFNNRLSGSGVAEEIESVLRNRNA